MQGRIGIFTSMHDIHSNKTRVDQDNMLRMRSLPGWLEVRVAQNTLNYVKLA